IRAAHQAVDHLAPLGRSKVERKRALALVPAEKAEAEVAERVALEAFDLDHVGAHLAQDHWSVRAGDVAAEIQYQQAIERAAREHGCARDIILAQDPDPFLARPRREYSLEQILQRLSMRARKRPTVRPRSGRRKPARAARSRARACSRTSRCRRQRTDIRRRR